MGHKTKQTIQSEQKMIYICIYSDFFYSTTFKKNGIQKICVENYIQYPKDLLKRSYWKIFDTKPDNGKLYLHIFIRQDYYSGKLP